jgi:hypothetical protein
MVGTIYSGRYRIGSSGTYTGITLSDPTNQNPATLANYLYANYGAAILGAAGTAWTVSNQGLIIDNGMSGAAGGYGTANNPGGIVLPSGGEVVNGSTGSAGQGQLSGGFPYYAYGRIQETTQGISISGGTGTVLNLGVITGAPIGVTLANGGTIINVLTAATIAGASIIAGNLGTVANYGVLGAGETIGSIGVDLLAGGLFANYGGAYVGGIAEIDGAAGTLVNAGTLAQSVSLTAGGTITNLAAGTLLSGLYVGGGAGTLVNAGTVSGMANFASYAYVANLGTLSGVIALQIAGNGTLVNGLAGSPTALITGAQYGVVIGGTSPLVTNYGTILSVGGQAALLLQAGGTIQNQGLLLEQQGSVAAAAVSLKAGGTLINNATISGAPFGAYVEAGTVLNNAIILAQSSGGDSGVGVEINASLLANMGTLLVNSPQAVGTVLLDNATVANSGLLAATSDNSQGKQGNLVAVGAYVLSGGTLLNTGTLVGAVIDANSSNGVLSVGILATGTLGISLNNSGSIIGANGVVIGRSQRVSIAGGYGYIDPKPNVTLVDSGLIDGTGGIAVQFGDGQNLLQLLPSADLVGAVVGGSGTNTLEFAAGAGTLYGLSSTITNFSVVHVDAAASWTVAGAVGAGVTLTNDGTLAAGQAGLQVATLLSADPGSTGTIAVGGSGVASLNGAVANNQTVQFLNQAGTLAISQLGGFAGTIAGFGGGDTIVLLGTTATKATYANQQLTISNAAGVLSTLAMVGTPPSNTFTTSSDSAGNTDIVTAPAHVTGGNAPCFAAGTRLRTAEGEIAVEALRVGMHVVTSSGAHRPIIWLGRRHINCQAHPKPEHVRPVRVQAEAFGVGLPQRDLVLSPDHAIAWNGALIPVRYLVNGTTVRQESVARVTYWHVELASHDIVFAEGLPTETYLDTGNRDQFEGGRISKLHADFANPVPAARAARFVLAGPEIAAAKAHLLARAALLGWHAASPFLHLEAGGKVIEGISTIGGLHRFLLPPGTCDIAIVSSTFTPAQLDPHSQDYRQLGRCVASMLVNGRPLSLDSRVLVSGFFPIEGQGRERWRWTSGRGVLCLPAPAALFELLMKPNTLLPSAAPSLADLPRQSRSC